MKFKTKFKLFSVFESIILISLITFLFGVVTENFIASSIMGFIVGVGIPLIQWLMLASTIPTEE